MRLSFVAIFLLIVGTVLFVVYWKVDQDFFSEKILWNEAQSRSELAALSRSVESELEGFSQILDLAYPSLKVSQKTYNQEQVYSHFQMIAKISEQNGEPSLEQKFFLEGSPVQSWGANYAYLALKGLRVSGDRTNMVMTLLDPDKKSWLLILTSSRVTQNQYAAILPANSFQGIVDRQKGQLNSVTILNSKAQVLGHSVAEYVGRVLNEDPLVQEFIKSGNASGSGIYNGLQNERVQGFYEQVSDSNIYVTVSTPLRTLLAERSKIKIHFVFMGLGISLLGVAMMMLLGGGESKDEHKNLALLSKSADAATKATPDVETKVEIPSLPPLPDAISSSTQETTEKAVETSATDKFDSLFNERKIQEAFSAIDNIESLPHPPAPPLPTVQHSDKVEIIELAAAVPPPLPMNTAKEINIQIFHKPSKLDQVEFKVRKPGQKNKNFSSSEGLI